MQTLLKPPAVESSKQAAQCQAVSQARSPTPPTLNHVAGNVAEGQHDDNKAVKQSPPKNFVAHRFFAPLVEGKRYLGDGNGISQARKPTFPTLNRVAENVAQRQADKNNYIRHAKPKSFIVHVQSPAQIISDKISRVD